jgi:hypothetical protein
MRRNEGDRERRDERATAPGRGVHAPAYELRVAAVGVNAAVFAGSPQHHRIVVAYEHVVVLCVLTCGVEIGISQYPEQLILPCHGLNASGRFASCWRAPECASSSVDWLPSLCGSWALSGAAAAGCSPTCSSRGLCNATCVCGGNHRACAQHGRSRGDENGHRNGGCRLEAAGASGAPQSVVSAQRVYTRPPQAAHDPLHTHTLTLSSCRVSLRGLKVPAAACSSSSSRSSLVGNLLIGLMGAIAVSCGSSALTAQHLSSGPAATRRSGLAHVVMVERDSARV